MKIPHRLLALCCCLLLGSVNPRVAAAAAADQERFAEIDAQLQRGNWEAARTASLAWIQSRLRTLFARDLAGAVARLAVAEAGMGLEEDAVWHWQIAQNLDRSESGAVLAGYGKAGELLAHHPSRRRDEAPAGMTVLRADDPAGGVRPGRKLEGELKLSAEVGRVPAPKGLKVQSVIDAEGRLREPVVVSGGVPGLIWESLEALRGWRYEPARKGDQAVAVFRDLTLNPPSAKPLSELTELAESAVEVDSLLRARKWREAQKRSRKLWRTEIERETPSRQRLAAILVLRALADAGVGETDAAVCRWQAAQHLDQRLYDADLSAYGTAGGLLDRNRWGAMRAGTLSGEVLQPEVLKKASFQYPSRSRGLRGVVVLTGIVDESGAFHQPTLLRMLSNGVIRLDEFESLSTADHLNMPRLVAISALDAVCNWRFRPATAGGQPVPCQEIVSIAFDTSQAVNAPDPLGRPTVHTQGPHAAPRPDPPISGPRIPSSPP